MYARWLVVMLLLPAATQSDDLGDPQLHGLSGARWFYQLGCQLEEQSMFDESLRSLQTSVRLQQESLSGTMICGVVPAGRRFTSPDFAEGSDVDGDPQVASREMDHLLQLVHNTSWEVKVRENAGQVGLGSSDNVQVELLDSIGSLPVAWQLGDNLQDIAEKVCCVGREGLSDACFDFSAEATDATDDGLTDGHGVGHKNVAAARAAGQSCSEYVHVLLETAEHSEFRDVSRRVVRKKDGSESEKHSKPNPPRYMPAAHRSGYLDEVGAAQAYYYFDDSQESYYSHFGKEQLAAMARLVARRRPGTNYADVDRILYTLLDAAPSVASKGLQHWMTEAAVVVVGSVVPWYEVLALESGAAFTFTLEYNEVRYDDPRMFSDTPARYWCRRREAGRDQGRELVEQEQQLHRIDARRFDVGLSISSIEHAGLGRYGDPLDPRADLGAMHELEDIIREDGLLILAVPVGQDTVMWNAHRVYGRRRLTLLIQNWTVLGVHGMRPEMLDKPVVPRRGEPQPVFLLRNARPGSPANFSDAHDPVWNLVFETGA